MGTFGFSYASVYADTETQGSNTPVINIINIVGGFWGEATSDSAMLTFGSYSH